MKAVVPNCLDHVDAHEKLEDVLDPEDVKKWREEIIAWETKEQEGMRNPYDMRQKRE